MQQFIDRCRFPIEEMSRGSAEEIELSTNTATGDLHLIFYDDEDAIVAEYALSLKEIELISAAMKEHLSCPR